MNVISELHDPSKGCTAVAADGSLVYPDKGARSSRRDVVIMCFEKTTLGFKVRVSSTKSLKVTKKVFIAGANVSRIEMYLIITGIQSRWTKLYGICITEVSIEFLFFFFFI